MTLLERITEAVKRFDREAAIAAARELAQAIRAVGARSATETSYAAIKRLREARYHDVAMLVADAVFESGCADSRLRVLYAQSLIDVGLLGAALPIVSSVAPDDPAYGEARGSMGRIYKQFYVNGGGDETLRQEYFRKAFDAYYGHFQDTGNTWHGINAVALIQLARRQGLPCEECDDAPLLARSILERLRGATGLWDSVTAGEAALATGDFAQARTFYAAFAARPDVSAFQLNSALRQLEEVWDLTADREPGASLLPLLRVAMLDRSGGEVELSAVGVRREMDRVDDRLQKVFGNEHAVPFAWYRQGLERCFSVCRIEDDQERAAGTGFVVRGGDFIASLADRLCILTNDHVVSEQAVKAVRPERAFACFHAVEGAPRVPIEAVRWRSSSAELDAALLIPRGDLPRQAAAYPIAEQPLDRSRQQKIFVIGHPLGGTLSLSLYDNLLLDCNETFVHYRSPTQPGSSGSPVFNAHWELVALHHAGHQQMRRLDGWGTYEANEGIHIARIRAAASQS